MSFNEEIEKRANAIIEERAFDGLSDLFQTLIREEYERRQLKVLKDAPGGPGKPAKPVNYREKTKTKPSSSSKKDIEHKIHDLIRDASGEAAAPDPPPTKPK